MIEVRNLVKEYKTKKGKTIGVNNVSLKVKEGEIFGIVGYSGAGKSSLLRCLNLLEKPTSGEVLVDGVNLTTLNSSELRKARLKIGMIFQHFYLISSKTVYENVAFALKAAGVPKKKFNERVTELLELVGLGDRASHYPAQLSGGQKQRVGIARALANNPKVLLCDEATSALDPSTTKSILCLLKSINKKLGITIVVITHEMEVVKEICDRMAVMQDGRVIEEGLVYDLFSNPKQPLTKDFIETVLQLQLPERLSQNRKGTLIKIQFKGVSAEEALISDVFKKFNVKGNILHGKIEYIKDNPLGIFIMEVTGDKQEVNQAIDYITKHTESLEVIADAA
ncbi:methionine ABC transporter ATP-binding protein [Pueribacillus theae]|uniref:Methionine ABC transporter ATP-binding protein n=1 Tax=Pueribacillus theae TaxID=2171751 RepID=A0A2U1JZ68_9BACI|nr:methionine ABC transporter ATP-binding protein [Pueribacillus theae]PWA10063.1 methionine ABC transporter ATP-binding protein [Pueribacillus theae]